MTGTDAPTENSSPPLRVAMAGCGLIAGGPVRDGRPIRGNHAQACRDVAGVELVAASDPNVGRLNAFGAYWGVGRLYGDVGDLLSHEQVDLLIVATDPQSHLAVSMAAVEAGVRGILCEKPLTGVAADAELLCSRAAQANIPLVANFSRRWDTSHQELRHLIENGLLGEPRHFTGCYTGTLRGNGTHLVDTLRMMWPVEWRTDWASFLDDGVADGAVAAELVSPTGTRANLFPIVDSAYFVFELQFFGSKGRARLLSQGNDLRVDLPATNPDFPGYSYLSQARELPRDSMPHSFSGALRALERAVRTGEKPSTPASEAVHSLRLVESIISTAARVNS